MVNMKDVALKAGVSVGTVSRVINNRGSISEKTRQKVFAVMKEMNYQPNEMARYLQNGRCNIIGLVVPHIDHPFFSALTEAISKDCKSRGYRLMLCTSGADTEQERENIALLRGNRVDGILISGHAQNAEVYTELELPLVSIERTIPNVPSISCDNYQGGVIAARALKQAGCRRVLIASGGGGPEMPALLRYDGFCDECRRSGLMVEEAALTLETLDSPEKMREMLSEHPNVDGYFATGDVMAVLLSRELLNSGKTMPQDFKMVGFDGLVVSEYFNITTVAQPIRQMGELAVDTLLRCIEGEMVPTQMVLPVQLIERISTGK